MSLWTLTLANLKFRWLTNLSTIILLSLGLAMIIALLHLSTQMNNRFQKDLKGVDLVVGAKGSPIQLILSSVFHVDIPTGNIPLKEAEKLSKHPLIAKAIPIALGDNYHGYRIIGTTQAYAEHYAATLKEGRYWDQKMQAVLGSEVAKKSGLKLGDTFSGVHGLTPGGEVHDAFPYTVVGILKPTGTVVDRVVLTDVSSVWHVHEEHDHGHEEQEHEEHGHHDHEEDEHEHEKENHHADEDREITSLLIQYKTPAAAVTLPRLINKASAMQAASPAFEVARLLKILGVGSDIILLIGGVLMALAALSFFVTLWSAVQDRRYDLALLRSLGATRRKIVALVLFQAGILAALGSLLGVVLGHLSAALAAQWLEQTKHIVLQPIGFHPDEAILLAIVAGISIVAAIIPAYNAYRLQVTTVLSRGE